MSFPIMEPIALEGNGGPSLKAEDLKGFLERQGREVRDQLYCLPWAYDHILQLGEVKDIYDAKLNLKQQGLFVCCFFTWHANMTDHIG